MADAPSTQRTPRERPVPEHRHDVGHAITRTVIIAGHRFTFIIARHRLPRSSW
jgi:hypothetical protein